MNKTELIQQLETLLANEDPEHVAKEVSTLKDAYEELRAAEAKVASEAAENEQDENDQKDAAPSATNGQLTSEQDTSDNSDSESTPDPQASAEAEETAIESAKLSDEEDKKFKQLMDAFHQRINEIRKERKRVQQENLKTKQELIAELEHIITEEENIGSAFDRFRAVEQKWKETGEVPRSDYRDLQEKYTLLADQFYYNIRIYKELREHDLRKNTGLKEALISDMEGLLIHPNFREMEELAKTYQEKWRSIGPVVREEWEVIRDRFHTATRGIYDRINAHYEARRSEQGANLEAKEHLVEKAREFVKQAAEAGTKDWKTLTDQVLELQNTWKTIGFATKKENERIWKEFRNTCNEFFDAKKAFFDGLNRKNKVSREMKLALIKQAEELKDTTAWRQTAEKLRELQKQWKDAGSAGPRDENRLWGQFRKACDQFFDARKAHFADADKEQEGNLVLKKALLKEMEEYTLAADKRANLDAYKAFSDRWNDIGRVPRKNSDKSYEKYRKLMDGLYGQLDIGESEKHKERFRNRINNVKKGDDAVDKLARQGTYIKRRIVELETELRQAEGNMAIFNFKSKTGEAMKKEMEKKLDKTRREIEQLRVEQRELKKATN